MYVWCASTFIRLPINTSYVQVKKFGAYGQGWWDDEGKHRSRSGAGPLHALNPVRVRYITQAITQGGKGRRNGALLLSGYRILDVGCGGGLLSEALARCLCVFWCNNTCVYARCSPTFLFPLSHDQRPKPVQS